MAATETSEILQALKEMDDEERQQAADLLAPHQQFTRRQFGGILAAVAGGTLSVQAAMAAVQEGVMPAEAADGVVNDIDTLQSGDGSDITVADALALSDLLKLNNVSTSSSISTNGRQFIACDVSIASITVTLSSADQALGVPIIVFDASNNAGSNAITIDTEGGETIDGQASIDISIDRGFELLFPDGSDWTTGRNFTKIATDQVDTDAIRSKTDIGTDVTRLVEEYIHATDHSDVHVTQKTQVSTSAKKILDTRKGSEGALFGGWLIVVGRAGGDTEFIDVATWLDSVNDITSRHSEAAGSAAGRTYSLSSPDIKLAMASGTYDVTAISFVGGVQS